MGGEGEDLDAGRRGGRSVEQIAKERGGGGPKVCKIFYLESFAFTNWLTGTFDVICNSHP